MFKVLKNRVLPFVCAFSILVSLCVVPAYADFNNIIEMPEPPMIRPEAIYDYELLQAELKRLTNYKESDNCAFVTNTYYLPNPDNWTVTSYDSLVAIATFWNFTYQEEFAITAQVVSTVLDDGTELSYIRAHLKDSVYQGREALQWCLTDGAYNILVSATEGSDAEFQGVWIPEDSFHSPYRYMGYEDLMNLALDLRADVAYNDLYYYIYREDGQLVYANSSGLPFVALRNPGGHASQTDRPVTDDPEDEVDDGFDAKIDLENGVINLPDGTLAFLDAVIYDESTKTYYVDSHDVTNNYYYFHYEYHINYTSITYIGQTEEYKKYEVSYLLPDGRDSADLTKEDLEQLNLSIDVIPYGRNVDDVSLRSLYHFDGDTRDASYWNYCTGFTWNEGASLTYMESGVFEGALYLDETEHDFTLRLPSDLGTGDFTLQYRIYQSHTLAPVTDSYISFGSIPLFQWSGGYFLDPDDTALHVTPTGTYNEIALIRDSGTIYYYLNGVCMGSYANTSALNDRITFHFGDQQETFKYFDELRVLNRALVEGGESYTPTSIPHDTNLELKVPTESQPVADEYWSITPTEGALVAYDFSSGALPDSFTDNFARHTDKANIYAIGSVDLTVESYANFTRFANTKGTGIEYAYNSGSCMNILFTPVGWKNAYNSYGVPGKTVTVSVVLSDGAIYSHTGVVGERSSVTIPNGEIGLDYAYPSSGSPTVSVAYIGVNANKSMDILYVEVVEGAVSNLTTEWIESITLIDKDSLNTPTLAVRTDLDITSYQIGGVRPSVPEKGMVWAMVENQRITSLQIYNGQAWEGVEGRIWTGSRWIPVGSYNVVTLQEMYDIVDATPNYECIYSESGFWAWWQKSWNAFTERLFAALGNGQGVAGGLPADQLPAVPDDETTEENEGWSVIELLVVLRDGTWKVITGTVSTAFDGFTGFVSSVSNAGGFFEAYDSKNPDGIFGTTYGGDDLWHQ